jgi:hypothetical protein
MRLEIEDNIEIRHTDIYMRDYPSECLSYFWANSQ